MPDRLLLRLHPGGDSTWLRQAADGRAATGSMRGLPPAAVLAAAGEIVVLVPAEDVLLTEARVTARNRAQLLQAIPFAVEDQLLSGVEELHFAASDSGGGAVGVAVVAKSTLRAWLEKLATAGIRPDVLVPESLAIPPASALIENDRAVVHVAEWSAFACPTAELPAWLTQAQLADSKRPLDIHDVRETAASRVPAAVATDRERQRDALAFLARGLGKPSLNLLHGEFAAEHRAARGARWWRIAASFAAAVFVLAFVNLGFEVLQLSRASARMDAIAEDAVRKSFPDIDAAELARIAPADVMRTRIERLRGGPQSSALLRVLAEIAPVIGNMARIQTRGMEFRNGSLELGLRAPDVASLDAVRERLAALPGLKVSVTAANPADNGIDGRIRIGTESAGGGTP